MKRRWWTKYLVLFVICLIASGVCFGIGGENGFFLLILYVMPVIGFWVLLYLVHDIFRSELFKKIDLKIWWGKYLLIVIPAISIYFAGWFDIPLDNRSFWFSRTIWFGKMIAPWKVFIWMPLIILALLFVSNDTFQYFKHRKSGEKK